MNTKRAYSIKKVIGFGCWGALKYYHVTAMGARWVVFEVVFFWFLLWLELAAQQRAVFLFLREMFHFWMNSFSLGVLRVFLWLEPSRAANRFLRGGFVVCFFAVTMPRSKGRFFFFLREMFHFWMNSFLSECLLFLWLEPSRAANRFFKGGGLWLVF